MKKIAFGILPLTLLGSLLFAGCASHGPEPVYVYTAPPATRTTQTIALAPEPPPPQVEIVSPASGPVDVWVQGNWNHTHGKWVWMPGHWESRPHANAIWMAGHWDKDFESNEWIWTPGHWA